MELLAPAGNLENFIAALEAGCDAIYLGGKAFSARAKASNFSIEELEKLVRIAHIKGVAIYVAVNIVISDQELDALETYIRELDRIGVDGIIVQDVAALCVAKRVSKHLEIHASTQMTASNLATVEYLYRLGMNRVVLSRELSLEEIRYITQHTRAEIEVFVHGALCVSYSGQCLMSSFIGGRSGNRGACAQPCRLPYTLLTQHGEVVPGTKDSYLMSPKDLNYAEYMKDLMDMGVASFKVEGRMKKAVYVREVIGTYRQIIDRAGAVEPADMQRLEKGFNRGFSAAHLTNQVGKEMITWQAPNHQGEYLATFQSRNGNIQLSQNVKWQAGDLLKLIFETGEVEYITVDKEWAQDGKNTILSKEKRQGRGKIYLAASSSEKEDTDMDAMRDKYPIHAYLMGEVGSPVSLTYVMEDGLSVTVCHEYLLQKAKNKPTSEDMLYQQLGRLGNTLFTLESVSTISGEYMWPSSVLNQLRREGIAKLEEALLARYEEKRRKRVSKHEHIFDAHGARKQQEVLVEECSAGRDAFSKENSLVQISVRVDSLGGARAALEGGADRILFGGDRFSRIPYSLLDYERVMALAKEYKASCYVVMPRVVRSKEEEGYKKTLEELVTRQVDGVVISSLGALLWLREWGYKGRIMADSALNVTNHNTMEFLWNEGISGVCVSEELTLEQIQKMSRKAPKGIEIESFVHGEVELMITEHCVICAFAGTGEKHTCKRPCLKERYMLEDRKGMHFPLYTDPYCRLHIMNSCELNMEPYVHDLVKKGVQSFRIEGRGKSAEYIQYWARRYKTLLMTGEKVAKLAPEKMTRGHYFKGIF